MALRIIKDPIWGNIPYSELESKFFSDQLFNRLHNVIQNSMAFKVYPSDKTSRFSHSIGTMHISSQIFVNSFSNANDDIIADYINLNKSKLDEFIDLSKNKLNKLGSYQISRISINEQISILCSILGNEFSNRIVQNKKISENPEFKFYYILLCESLRMYSLLHDIGHLPFSHIMEFAISDFADIIETSDGVVQNTLFSYFKRIKDDSKNFDRKMHEIIGEQIIAQMFKAILDFYRQDNNSNSKLWQYVIVNTIFECVNEISRENDGDFPSLWNIVSGDLGSDRIDFTSRDGLSSGLIKATGDVERVLQLFCLGKINKDTVKYLFMPSIQSLNDIQELLVDRFRIYKYIVNHHKVKKSDYILQYAIEIILIDEFKRLKSDFIAIASRPHHEILNLIDIGDVINTIFSNSNPDIIYYLFAQLNDYWLLSFLHKEYANLKLATDIDNNKRILLACLEDIFTGSKKFISIWKRDYEFIEFLQKIGSKLENQSEILESIFPEDFKSNNKFYLELISTEDSQRRGKLLIRCLTMVYPDWTNTLQKKFVEKNQVVLLSRPHINTGLNMLYVIDLKNQNSIKEFDKASSISTYLENMLDETMQIFAFYNIDSFEGEKNIQYVKSDIEKYIIEGIVNYIEEIRGKTCATNSISLEIQ
jgi:uncharacterized protein